MFARKSLVAVLSLIALILISSSPALACACCVNRGYYELSRQRPDSFYLGLLGDIKLGGDAELYMTEAGFDGIKGLKELENPDSDPKLSVSATFAQNTWRLNVKSGVSHSGMLWLPMPAMFTKHKADIDGVDTGLGVSLYKEFSISGNVSHATGMFRSANKMTKYTLVFQGRGNGCDDASDFTRWRLELDGPKAEYAFFGKAAS